MSAQKPVSRSYIVQIAIVIIIISVGIRQSFGIFLRPLVEDLNISRETFSLAIAIQQLIYGFPLIGILADRYGSRWVAIGGGLLYSAAIFWFALDPSVFTLFTSFGVLVGVALSATTYVVALGAVAKIVPAERRSTAFGLITAAGSFGMFAVVFGMEQLRNVVGWQTTFMFMGGMVLLIVLVATGFPGANTNSNQADQDDLIDESAEPDSMMGVLVKAGKSGSYWLLFAGFFTCGFHVAFVSTHLPAYLVDKGIAASIGALALSLIGLFNMVGSPLSGWLGDRYRKKYLLSGIYFGRAVVFALFLLMPLTNASALIFGAAFGILYLATVPLTSGLVAQIFGSKYLSTLYGFVFFGHQIGSFLGVWLGGRFFDTQGSYIPVWIIGIILAIAAGFIHMPISDRSPLVTPQPTVGAD
ncbi:MAG: MFS transporter [Chloroflexota bacterium]